MGKAGLFLSHPAVPALGSYGPYCWFPVLSLNFFLLIRVAWAAAGPCQEHMRRVWKGLGQSLGWERRMCGERKQENWSSNACPWLKLAKDEGADGE